MSTMRQRKRRVMPQATYDSFAMRHLVEHIEWAGRQSKVIRGESAQGQYWREWLAANGNGASAPDLSGRVVGVMPREEGK